MTLHRAQVNSKRKHWRAAWRIFIPARRFKQQNPKLYTDRWTAWRLMHARQAVSGQNPEITKNSAYQSDNPWNYDCTRHNRVYTINSTQKQLPLPGFLALHSNPWCFHYPEPPLSLLLHSHTIFHPQFFPLFVPNHRTPLPNSLSVSSSLSFSLSLSQLYPF